MFKHRTLFLRLGLVLVLLLGLGLAASWLVRSLAPNLAGKPARSRPVHPELLPGPGADARLQEHASLVTPVPGPTQLPAAARQQTEPVPLVRGGFIASSGWSSQTPWLAYWYTATRQANPSNSAWPASELQFINPASGQLCTHPDVVAFQEAPGTWTPDGSFLVATGERYLAGEPCEDFRVLSPAQYEELLPDPLYDVDLSTLRNFQASTRVLSRTQGILRLETIFTEVDSGAEVYRLEWERPEGPEEAGLGGMWRNDWQFLLHQTLERGPLLVSLRNPLDVIEVVPELFGIAPPLNGNPGPFAGWVVTSTPFYGHLLLQRPGAGAQRPEILFFHRGKNQVESLPFSQVYDTGFYPSWRSGTKPWLMMVSEEHPGEEGQQSFYYREMDALGEEFTLLGSGSPTLEWLRDIYYISGNRLALGWEDGEVRVQTFPGEQVVAEYSTGIFQADHLAWSTGGRFLAVSGARRGTPGQMGLFVFEIPQP